MKRTIEYLKNLKEDVTHSIENEHSTSITVDSKDLKHINEAIEDIEKLQNQLDAKLTFISNGKEEELYALQEENIALKAISSVTVYDNGVGEINYSDRQSMLINNVLYSDGFLSRWEEEDCGIKR